MQTVHYKRGDMIGQAIGCLALAVGSVWMAANFHGTFKFLGVFLAVTLPFLAVALFARAAGDCIALQFDGQSLSIKTLWRKATVPWKQVTGIHRETLRQTSMFGLIRQDIGFYLVVTLASGGLGSNKFQLDERLLDWPKGALPTLLDDLARAGQLGRVAGSEPEPRSAPTFAKTRDPLEGARATDDFDPDAVMARYLAGRTAQDSRPPSAPPRPSAPGFGRRIR